ncbi:MAG: S-adenosyl-l-methionine hydroxide adenosyltransferase family protein, partial [Chitinophagales bacterium]
LCRSAIKNFPDFTYHIILVNLFESKPEQLLLAFHKNQYLLCADNGLLTMILEEKPEMVIGVPLDKTATKDTIYFARAMGKIIKQLSEGASIKNIGTADVNYLQKNHLRPLLGSNWIEGQIVFIDNFENVIVNITRDQFEEQRKGRNFRIVFKREEVIDHISESYADVPEGEKLALFNSAGYLEIAINKGNAAGLFGLKGFSERAGQVPDMMQNQLAYQMVRVYFE